MSRPSLRARSIEPFLAMEVMERAFELERAGARVIHLEIGEPEFAAPEAATSTLASLRMKDFRLREISTGRL